MQALVGMHPPECRLRARMQRDAGVARQLARVGEVDDLLLVELVDHRAPGVELHEAGPAGVGGELVAVLVGFEPDDPGLQAQRQVLGDDDDLAALAAEAVGDGEDAVVVGVGGERLREGVELLVVELDPQRAALVVHRHRLEQRAVLGAEVLQEPQPPAGRPPQLGVVALALELGEHHEREHDLVFREPRDRQRIRQEYRGVDDVDGRGDQGTGDASPRRGAVRGHSVPTLVHTARTCCTHNPRVGCLAWSPSPPVGLGRAMPVAVERTDAIIAGVNKAGTTSLFVSLSTHPDVAPSSIKETGYFLPARYGAPLEPASVWDGYFADAGDRPVHLEATPSYFYGAERVAEAHARPAREPARAARVPRTGEPGRSRSSPTRRCGCGSPPTTRSRTTWPPPTASGPTTSSTPRTRSTWRSGAAATPTSCPAWLDTFGAERVHVIDFQRLVDDQAGTLRATATALGIDPLRFPADALSSENRTTGFRSKSFQRVALAGNDRLEKVLRRHPDDQAQAPRVLLPAQRPQTEEPHLRRGAGRARGPLRGAERPARRPARRRRVRAPRLAHGGGRGQTS